MREVDRDKRVWLIEKAKREGRYMAGPRGQVAQWSPDEGAHLRPYTQSQIHEGRLQDPGIGDPSTSFKAPVLRKRTHQERLESMIRRLKDVHPVQQAALLQQIGAEYWKAGMPVTQEALAKAAATILNGADKRLTLTNRTAGGRDGR